MSKVPTDQNMSPEVRRFLDDMSRGLDGLTPESLGITGDILTHDADEFFQVANNLSEATAATARSNLSAAAKLQTGFVSGIFYNFNTAIPLPIIEAIPHAATLTRFTARTNTGSVTAALEINGIAVTSGSIAVTTSQQSVTPSAANAMAINDLLHMRFSSLSSPTILSWTVAYTHTLD